MYEYTDTTHSEQIHELFVFIRFTNSVVISQVCQWHTSSVCAQSLHCCPCVWNCVFVDMQCLCVGVRSGFSWILNKWGNLCFLYMFTCICISVCTCVSQDQSAVSPTLVCAEVMLSTLPTWRLWLCTGLHHASPTHTPMTGNRGQRLCFHLLYPGCAWF